MLTHLSLTLIESGLNLAIRARIQLCARLSALKRVCVYIDFPKLTYFNPYRIIHIGVGYSDFLIKGIDWIIKKEATDGVCKPTSKYWLTEDCARVMGIHHQRDEVMLMEQFEW
jgi:hypothetical protein